MNFKTFSTITIAGFAFAAMTSAQQPATEQQPKPQVSVALAENAEENGSQRDVLVKQRLKELVRSESEDGKRGETEEAKSKPRKAGKKIEIVEREESDDRGDRPDRAKRRFRIERFDGPGDERDILIRRRPGMGMPVPPPPGMRGGEMHPQGFPMMEHPSGPDGRLGHLEEAIRHLHEGGFNEAAERLEAQAEKMRRASKDQIGPGNPDSEQFRDLQRGQKELRGEMEKLRKEFDRLREKLSRVREEHEDEGKKEKHGGKGEKENKERRE